ETERFYTAFTCLWDACENECEKRVHETHSHSPHRPAAGTAGSAASRAIHAENPKLAMIELTVRTNAA
ncbi:MAG: hypothetical protein WCS01_06860, partial [bacterium]